MVPRLFSGCGVPVRVRHRIQIIGAKSRALVKQSVGIRHGRGLAGQPVVVNLETVEVGQPVKRWNTTFKLIVVGPESIEVVLDIKGRDCAAEPVA